MNLPARSVLLQAADALIVVDVQRDFLPGGALAVPHGDDVVPVLNRYVRLFGKAGLPIIFSRDWHPYNHCSFRGQGGPWPVHCVAESPGADFAPGLEIPAAAVLISKATLVHADAYSAFQGTDLAQCLRRQGSKRLFIGGLATDYCVLETVRDALRERFEVLLLEDAIRAVDIDPGDGLRAVQAMKAAGAGLVSYDSMHEAGHET